MPIILVLRRQSKWIFEFKTSLIYIKRSCPKKKKKKKPGYVSVDNALA